MAIKIGWGSCDITPQQPVYVSGQFHSRVSEGVMDPITANILALESDDSDSGRVIMLSCDVVTISDAFRNTIREKTIQLLPEIKPENIIINATHTHEAPEVRPADDSPFTRPCMGNAGI